MRKYLFLAAAALMVLAACTSEDIVDKVAGDGQGNAERVMGFNVRNKNMTRAGETLESTGVYGFGAYAYKNPTTPTAVMENYLVGYYGTGQGYDATATSLLPSTIATTEHPASLDGYSLWFYEGLGNTQYNSTGHTPGSGYYNKTDEADMMSGITEQYLKYWDKSTASTSFFAYTPYDNNPSYTDADNGTLILNKTIQSGWTAGNEILWAASRVVNADYGKDVPLSFKHSGAKIQIAFYEAIKGYDVEILDLGYKVKADGSEKSAKISGTPVEFVKGAISEISETRKKTTGSTPYADAYTQYVSRFGEIGELVSSLTDVTFTNVKVAEAATISTMAGSKGTLTAAAGGTKDPYGDGYYLEFTKPSGNITDFGGDNAASGTKNPTKSTKKYFAVPGANDGFIIHVSFKLKAKGTNEEIYIQDATAYVGTDYTTWAANKVYTYIFKITDNAKGWPSTGPDAIGVDPTSREIPTDNSLNPIVFDGLTVADYDDPEIEHEFTISNGISGMPSSLSIVNGSTYNLTITLQDLGEGQSKGVTFTSSYASVATVNDNATATVVASGENKATVAIKALAVGTSDITVTNNGTTKKFKVTVTAS